MENKCGGAGQNANKCSGLFHATMSSFKVSKLQASGPTPTLSSSGSSIQNSFPPTSKPSSGPIYTFVIAQRLAST